MTNGQAPGKTTKYTNGVDRHLLTHSSGLTYAVGHPGLAKLQKQEGKEPGSGSTVEERCTFPLLYEPGTKWSYGVGIDWAGKLVERLTGETLEVYMKKNLFEPVGAKTITFWPYEHEDLKGKVPGIVQRTPEGKLVPMTGSFLNTGSTDCFGGHGAYASMEDYLKIQRSILANDGKLLKPATVEQLFTPQLTQESAQALNHFLNNSPLAALFIGDIGPDTDCNWGLGGILFMNEKPGKWKKGTLSWGGMANTFWLIDREADMAVTFGTQVLPPGDKGAEGCIMAAIEGCYEKAGVKF